MPLQCWSEPLPPSWSGGDVEIDLSETPVTLVMEFGWPESSVNRFVLVPDNAGDTHAKS